MNAASPWSCWEREWGCFCTGLTYDPPVNRFDLGLGYGGVLGLRGFLGFAIGWVQGLRRNPSELLGRWWVVLGVLAPPANEVAGGVNNPKDAILVLGGAINEPPLVRCAPKREREADWGLGAGLWGLTPPADGTAGGVSHPYTTLPAMERFHDDLPPVECMQYRGEREK